MADIVVEFTHERRRDERAEQDNRGHNEGNSEEDGSSIRTQDESTTESKSLQRTEIESES